MHERGDSFPLDVRRGERRCPEPAAEPFVELFGTHGGNELPASPLQSRILARGSPRPASARPTSSHRASQRRCGHALQTKPSRGGLAEGLRGLPAVTRCGWTLRLPHPQPFLCNFQRADWKRLCHPPLRQCKPPGQCKLGGATFQLQTSGIPGARNDLSTVRTQRHERSVSEPHAFGSEHRSRKLRVCLETLVKHKNTIN